MKRFLQMLIACFSILGVTLACALDTPTPSPSVSTQQEQSINRGLDAFSSYRRQATILFKGQDENGAPLEVQMDFLEEVNRDEQAQHRMSRIVLPNLPPGSFELYQMGDRQYLVSSEISASFPCIMLPQVTEQEDKVLKFDNLFEGLSLGEKLGTRTTFNGIEADHFRVGNLRLSLGTPQQWNAEIWVDAQHSAVLYFKGSAEGEFAIEGHAAKGTLSWEYYLLDLQNTHVSLPKECENLTLKDLPLPLKILSAGWQGSQLTLKIAQSAQEVVNQLRNTLVQSGWELTADAGTGEVFTLSATKEGKVLQITIRSLEKGSQVEIILP